MNSDGRTCHHESHVGASREAYKRMSMKLDKKLPLTTLGGLLIPDSSRSRSASANNALL